VDRDYLQDAQKTRVRDYYVRAQFDRTFKRDQMILRVNGLDRILDQNEQLVTINRYPEFRYLQPSRPIGARFCWRNQVYAGYMRLGDVGPDRVDEKLARVGMDAEIARTRTLTSFLHTRYGLGYQAAYSGLEDAHRDDTQAN